MTTNTGPTARFAPAAAMLLAALAIGAAAASADDRDLLRLSGAEPYVFVIFDTSGSMNLTAVCTAADAADDIDPYDASCTSECPLGDACAQVCGFGCVKYDDAVDVQAPIDVEVDESSPGVVITGTWSPVGATDATGGVALSDGNTLKGTKSVSFSLTVPATRDNYKVMISVPQSDLWATNVPVTVTAPGINESIVVSQASSPSPDYDPWLPVTVLPLNAGDVVTVIVNTTGTSEPVVADGARLLSEKKLCLEQDYRCDQPLCPTGDCFAPLNADDPSSKMFQARQAMYEVLEKVEQVRFGFATFEQDAVKVGAKHWLYEVRELEEDPDPLDGIDPPAQTLITLPGSTPFPAPGALEVFGLAGFEGFGSFQCSFGPGCAAATPAALDDASDALRLHRLPKHGIYNGTGLSAGLSPTVYYMKETAASATTYRVEWAPGGRNYGDLVYKAIVTVYTCNDAACSSRTLYDSTTVDYDLVSDFVGYDEGPPGSSGVVFGFDAGMSNTCGHGVGLAASGWDPNTDPDFPGLPGPSFDFSQDKLATYNLKWPTVPDARSAAGVLDEGDVIPLDWGTGAEHTREIQERMAPNIVTAPVANLPVSPPDFRTAVYLNDLPLAGDTIYGPFFRLLRLKNDTVGTAQRPPIAGGRTPLGYSLQNFLGWYQDFAALAATQVGVDASGNPITNDPDWICRRNYVLMLTDGDDTCSFDLAGNVIGPHPCDLTGELHNDHEVDTFVVGFGLDANDTSNLGCMAANGGTDQPIFPKNKDDLVDTLSDIFGAVEPKSRAFASASVPAVQSTAADKIYLSSFTPLPSSPYWPGRVDVFREPLPLDANGSPDVCNQPCGGGRESGCHLHNIGEVMLTQGPTTGQLDNDEGNMGTADTERRVFYSRAHDGPSLAQSLRSVPRLFELPDLVSPNAADVDVIDDLREVLISPTDPDVSPSDDYFTVQTEVNDKLRLVFRRTLEVKTSSVLGTNTCNGNDQYLLGDVFHADPVIHTGPSNLRLFRNNPDDYRAFVFRNQWRRRMLVVGANDGQLHFFDAGVHRELPDPSVPAGTLDVFDDGSGKELFAYIPRLTMPIVREQANGENHIYSNDGAFNIGEAYFDADDPLSPDPANRTWRVVLVAGLREAGDVLNSNADVEDAMSGYYALDITQPDELELRTDGQYVPTPEGEVVPTCLKLSGPELAANASCEGGIFPNLLWEFTDRVFFEDALIDDDSNGIPDYDPGSWYRLDEDQNGLRDMADTWSRPLIERIRVIDPVEGSTTKWVAILGGGIAPERKAAGDRGNFLYMIDLETGNTIYKREVDGAIPMAITGLDDDADSIIDFLYFGTTAGYLYKVDLRLEMPIVAAQIPAASILDSWPAAAGDVDVERITDIAWEPFKVFDTGGRPLYHPPAVIFVPELDRYALALGTGDREDLFTRVTQEGRFYVIVDQVFTAASLPAAFTEADFITFDFDAPPVGFDAGGNPLIPPPNYLRAEFDDLGNPVENGWIMRLPVNARITTRAFALGGVLVFTSFQPTFQDPIFVGDDLFCERTGISRTFVVDARNADPLTTLKNLRDNTLSDQRVLEADDRYAEALGFGTSPFVSAGATKNPTNATAGNNPLDSPTLRRLLENMKEQFFPPGCEFNDSFFQMIRMQLDNTGTTDLAPVPIGLCPGDWGQGSPPWMVP